MCNDDRHSVHLTSIACYTSRSSDGGGRVDGYWDPGNRGRCIILGLHNLLAQPNRVIRVIVYRSPVVAIVKPNSIALLLQRYFIVPYYVRGVQGVYVHTTVTVLMFTYFTNKK